MTSGGAVCSRAIVTSSPTCRAGKKFPSNDAHGENSLGWIPKVGDLVREKVAVKKKEFCPSYHAPVPVLGIHGTRTVILPPLAGAKENRFVSINNVKLHHVADPAQPTKRKRQ
ncbi:hypothetical protein NDU88_006008 [Pleurodeles waltl]|uniref:Retroviral integrase C-terminal SH3 domain-containing protein n=1 Tax=Pleurodeles waltl TaxID=8319 RepID=A0AAV7WDG9_PLEWA|nr:hypothetical protein NDU88_006008 [Pleurodeles waltl]